MHDQRLRMQWAELEYSVKTTEKNLKIRDLYFIEEVI